MKLIPLTKGYFAKVDDDDFERLSRYKWQISIGKKGKGTPYAKRSTSKSGKKFGIYMHREVLNISVERGKFGLDHIDGDSLNNQKANLRLATYGQNAMNRRTPKHSTPFKGVTLCKAMGKFQAYIQIEKKLKHLGFFEKCEDAAMAYDVAAIAHFGEFALTNQQLGVL